MLIDYGIINPFTEVPYVFRVNVPCMIVLRDDKSPRVCARVLSTDGAPMEVYAESLEVLREAYASAGFNLIHKKGGKALSRIQWIVRNMNRKGMISQE